MRVASALNVPALSSKYTTELFTLAESSRDEPLVVNVGPCGPTCATVITFAVSSETVTLFWVNAQTFFFLF